MDTVESFELEAAAALGRGESVALFPSLQLNAFKLRPYEGRDPTTGARVTVDPKIAIRSGAPTGGRGWPPPRAIAAFYERVEQEARDNVNQHIAVGRLGTLLVNAKQSRVGRNPETRSPIAIGGRSVMTFRPSAWLKSLINGEPLELSAAADQQCAALLERYPPELDADGLIEAFRRVGVPGGGLDEATLTAIETKIGGPLPTTLRRLHRELDLTVVAGVRFFRSADQIETADDGEDDEPLHAVIADLAGQGVELMREQREDLIGMLPAGRWLTLVPLAAELQRLPGAPSPAAYAPLVGRFMAKPAFDVPF